MRKASLLLLNKLELELEQTFLPNGSSCIQEFLFEVRFCFSSKNGH